MNRKKAAVIAGGAAVLAAILLMTTTPRYTYYFPIAPEGGAVGGVAWAPAWSVSRIQRDFGLSHFTHSASYQEKWIRRGGIPYLRPDNEAKAIAALRAQQYCGWLIFLNEPDRPDQDNLTPQAAAAMYRRVRPQLPCATFIVGNPIDLAWADRFLALVKLRPGDVLGIHIYQDGRWSGNPSDPRFTWPAQWIDRAVVIAEKHGLPARIAVTEFGAKNTWSTDEIRRYTREVQWHPAVFLWLVYTSHCGGYSPEACSYNLYESRERPVITRFGRVLANVPYP